jgi:citrate synthase
MRSSIAWSDQDSITVRGLDLTRDIIGEMTPTELMLFLLKGKKVEDAERRMLDALLVTLAEHGMTPSVIAARMTILGSPEALQAAVAAGLLGAGSVYLGTTEQATLMLQEALNGQSASAADPLSEIAVRVVGSYRERRQKIPGIGHPIHTGGDPRTLKLFALADELGFSGSYIALMQAVAAEASARLGRPMPINAAGAVGAIAAEMGLDGRIVRGIGIVARCIGLLGHLQEEILDPIATEVWELVEDTIEYPPGARSGTRDERRP